MDDTLLADEKRARIVLQALLFTIIGKVLYFIDQTKNGAKRIVCSHKPSMTHHGRTLLWDVWWTFQHIQPTGVQLLVEGHV